MHHPFFWSPAKRLNFLCDVSDHWERETREPPSTDLLILESFGASTHNGDFLKKLDRKFIDTLGKQRKYTGDRMLDLLRALRNKKNHYADMPEDVKLKVGDLPNGYLKYWTNRFPTLLIACYEAVRSCGLGEDPRFRPYLDNV
jgi:serine/threonine-protein kinase/endoribonuclease IRE1